MDNDKIRALLTVLEKGNLGDAADRLGYTPSGISRMMASLEEETGCTLLNRSRKGVTPTTECEALLPTMRGLAQLDEQYRQIAAGLQGMEIGTVRIGNAYYFLQDALIQTTRKFTTMYPGIKVELIEEFSTSLADKLTHNELDICIMSKRDIECDWHLLQKDKMVVWLPEDSKFKGKKYPIKHLEEVDFIEMWGGGVTDGERTIRENGIQPDVKYSVRTDQSAYAMVAAGLGVALTNGIYAGYVPDNIHSVPTDPEVTVDIGIATAPADRRSPATTKFLSMLYAACVSELSRAK